MRGTSTGRLERAATMVRGWFTSWRKNDGWIFSPLYSFPGGDNGNGPSPVIVGANGSLYGAAGGGIKTGRLAEQRLLWLGLQPEPAADCLPHQFVQLAGKLCTGLRERMIHITASSPPPTRRGICTACRSMGAEGIALRLWYGLRADALRIRMVGDRPLHLHRGQRWR